jgi:GAF domain-containing protein
VDRFVLCKADSVTWITAGDALAGLLGKVVAERQAIRGENPGGNSATLQMPSRHPDVHAFLAAPVASPSHVFGWICLVGNEGRTFTEDDEHLVVALVGQVGRIYELEQQIRERNRAELELTSERRRQVGLQVGEVLKRC